MRERTGFHQEPYYKSNTHDQADVSKSELLVWTDLQESTESLEMSLSVWNEALQNGMEITVRHQLLQGVGPQNVRQNYK